MYLNQLFSSFLLQIYDHFYTILELSFQKYVYNCKAIYNFDNYYIQNILYYYITSFN